jgi:hypothetical protein
MTERGILYSAPMIKALKAETKLETRRVVVPGRCPRAVEPGNSWTIPGAARPFGCPYGVVGDYLLARETWAAEAKFDALKPRDVPKGSPIHRLADGPKPEWCGKTRVAIFLPRWAQRLKRRITEIRVERVQEITEEGARREGVTPFPRDPEGDCWTDGKHRTAYEYLWGEINGWNGPRSWGENPFVWVVCFEPIFGRRA